MRSGPVKNEHSMSASDHLRSLVPTGTWIALDAMVLVFTWLVSRRLYAVLFRRSSTE